jgi:VIT1/CCC1 family predicted Fe2+/Mn2+ transporter
MSDTAHAERHAPNNNLMRNFIVGFSDGLTVPFALTAGLSSLNSSKLVILAGLAELFSGAISMGLSSYLAASTDAKQYAVEMLRERKEIETVPWQEEQEIYNIFREYGIEPIHACMVAESLKGNLDMWVKVRSDVFFFPFFRRLSHESRMLSC